MDALSTAITPEEVVRRWNHEGGGFDLNGLVVEGDLDFTYKTIYPSRHRFSGVTVQGNLILRNTLFKGGVSLSQLKVAGDLILEKAEVIARGSARNKADLSLEDCDVEGSLSLRLLEARDIAVRDCGVTGEFDIWNPRLDGRISHLSFTRPPTRIIANEVDARVIRVLLSTVPPIEVR